MNKTEKDTKPKGSKQKDKQIEHTLNINGRDATTVAGAILILNQRALEELGITRNYSRDAVYAMYTDGKIEGIHTPSANYYFVDSLQKVKIASRNYTHKENKQKPGRGGYSHELREQAFKLVASGLSRRAAAKQLGVSNQTINNWYKQTNS